ncbi:MAG: rod shape-determining protein MreC [Candidatus Caenarcaniphilales bacterium]|jgi:rod shape-determining protein MreC|nr:rod shape-determining protein MreC [Candidatus Caenarcaniphilales bacterium]
MDSKSLKSLSISVLLTVAVLWVFARPLGAFGLFIYRYTGAYVFEIGKNLEATQANAQDVLEALDKVEKLEKANKALKLENNLYKAQAKEAKSLSKALAFKQSFHTATIAARIIGRSPDSWHKQVIIDKGSNNGVKVGKGVITEHGVIGQVKKVSNNSAIIQLVYDPEWRMGVKIIRLGQYGILIGNHPEAAQVQSITIDSDVKVGDEIVSAGICIDSGNCPYPENYPVAKVVEVARDPSEVNLVVKVKFHEDISTIREIFILK